MKTAHKKKAMAVAAVVSTTFGLLVICLQPVRAQSQDPDKQKTEVQLLKEKMQQLEQTVEALKTQLKSIEEANKPAQAATGEKVATTAPSTNASTVTGPRTVTAPATGATPAGDQPQGESSFQIYGFAMLDAGYQFKQADPNWFDTVRPVKLPAFSNEFAPNGNFYESVRQSRFGAKSSTPTKYGEFKTIFEFELFGTGVDAGQTTFRLRHAYGELGHFGAGQYWSVFVDPDVFPNTNEYWGPNGIPWFRNVQFRWMPLKGRNSVTIGLERPGASADLGRAADRIEGLGAVKPRFPLPDLTGNIRFDRNWGHFQASGVVREIKWVDPAGNLSGSATGAGLSLNSGVNFGKNNVGKFSFTYGHGMQNYMNDAPVDVSVKANPGGGPLVPVKGVALPVTATMAYLDHKWNDRFSSSIGYSFLQITNSNGQTRDAFIVVIMLQQTSCSTRLIT